MDDQFSTSVDELMKLDVCQDIDENKGMNTFYIKIDQESIISSIVFIICFYIFNSSVMTSSLFPFTLSKTNTRFIVSVIATIAFSVSLQFVKYLYEQYKNEEEFSKTS
jgi:hypothetical protein